MMARNWVSPAIGWYLAGAAACLAAALTMGDRLFPYYSDVAVKAIWGISVCLIAAGFIVGLLDLVRLTRERRALTLAGVAQGNFSEVVVRRPSLATTLIGSRALRVRELRLETGASLQGVRQGLRAEALSKSAPLGTFTRFLASVLLLLAVLGTFAGMKTALPALVEVLQIDKTDPNSIDPTRIREALRGVENAFGANYLALVGALGLMLVTFGAASDRKVILAQLERFSDRYLYPQLPAGADATAIERVVLELRTSIGEVATVAASIGDLRGSIDSLQSGLSQAISGMHAAFTGQFQKDLIRYHADHAERSAELTKGVADIATSLSVTAVAYQGLVEGLRERDYGLKSAAASAQLSAETAAKINERLSADLGHAAGDLRQAAAELGTLSERVLDRLEAASTTHLASATAAQ